MTGVQTCALPIYEFVPPDALHAAYDDKPLSIGEGQTISQPYMVASMLEALELQPTDTVLEVGTGSGYQAALLAELAAEVFTIERWPSLAAQAQRILVNLVFDAKRVQLIVRDDGRGFNHQENGRDGHFGLIGMRERAQQIGGTLLIQSNDDSGTEVVADVPISS